jgi:hypothetical protein
MTSLVLIGRESAKRRGGATSLAPGLARVLIPPVPEKRYRAIRSPCQGRSVPGERGFNLSLRRTNPGRRYHDLTAVGIWSLCLLQPISRARTVAVVARLPRHTMIVCGPSCHLREVCGLRCLRGGYHCRVAPERHVRRSSISKPMGWAEPPPPPRVSCVSSREPREDA